MVEERLCPEVETHVYCIGSYEPIVALGGSDMAWTTPKVVEIAVGLEINSYVCAEL